MKNLYRSSLFMIIFFALSHFSLVAQCFMVAEVLNVNCEDNGTPTDLSDDLFNFNAWIYGDTVAGDGWLASDGSTGVYDTLASFGPFPISDGPVIIIFTDNVDADCTTSITVAPPDCSNACQVTTNISNITCDDAGTPEDPSDDTFTADLLIDGAFTSGSSWFATDPNNTMGNFGETTTFGPYLISGAGVLFSIFDAENTNCGDSLWISAPPPCSNDYIDLELYKAVSNPVAEPGETITFYIDIVNNGPAEATGIEVTDYLPDGYESVSNISNGGVFDGNQIVWSDLEILVGDSLLFLSFDVVVAEDGEYLNSAEITAADQFDPDSTPGNGVDTDADGTCTNDPDDEDDGDCAGIISCADSGLIADGGPDITLGCQPNSLITLVGEVIGGQAPYSYQWLINGNVLSTSQVLTIEIGGTFTFQVIDANGCIAQDEVLVIEVDQTIAEAGDHQTIDCNNPTAIIDGSGSSQGDNYSYEWTGPDGFTSTDLINEVTVGGWYTLQVFNENDSLCTASDWVYVSEERLTGGLDYYLISCGEAGIYNVFLDTIPTISRTWTFPDGTTSDDYSITTTQSGYHYLELFNEESGCYGIDSIYLDLDQAACSLLSGKVFWDEEPNCALEASEAGLSEWMLQFTDGDHTFYKVTDSEGNYEISLPLGTFTVSVILPSNVWYPCSINPVTFNSSGGTTFLNIPVQKAEECPVMTVDISTFWLRSCRDNTYWVDYCNEGTATAEDAYVTVQIDPSLTYTSSSIPLTSQDGNLLTFALGDVAVNECEYFWIKLFIDCDATLGQTHCAEAHIYPDSLCLPPPAAWSGASLEVDGNCEDDEVNFIIKNVGEGNMAEPANFIVIEDGVMMIVAPGQVQLNSTEDFQFSLPANGTTYRLEADQVPDHPGASMPSITVEGCGVNENGGSSTGFVNLFPMDDENPFIDVECRENNGPYDPNDKTGFPRGFGEEHYIHENIDMEYLIRFQNVGTDTAFKVVIRDTISPFLDITSLRPGVSSHEYTWDIDRGNAVVFTFENIMLPDSNVNVDGSQGFIKFNIAQKQDLPLETVIENNASIYFDFNEPVITNTTFHTIGKDFLEVVDFVAGPNIAPDALSVYPNPAKNVATFQLKNWQGGLVDLQLYDAQGRLLLNDRFNGNIYELNRKQLSAGLYFFRLESEGVLIGSGKLVME